MLRGPKRQQVFMTRCRKDGTESLGDGFRGSSLYLSLHGFRLEEIVEIRHLSELLRLVLVHISELVILLL